MKKTMPTIQISERVLNSLRDDQVSLIDMCLNKDKLRATKPKDGVAAYVWRMAAFQVSPKGQHHCMPVTADFDMPQAYWGLSLSERASHRKSLDVLVDVLVDAVPVNERHGINRWAKAFGY